MASIKIEIDFEDILYQLSKTERERLHDELHHRFKQESEESMKAETPFVESHAYRALQHLRAGEFEDARWELERAFNPPMSKDFKSKRFVKEVS